MTANLCPCCGGCGYGDGHDELIDRLTRERDEARAWASLAREMLQKVGEYVDDAMSAVVEERGRFEKLSDAIASWPKGTHNDN